MMIFFDIDDTLLDNQKAERAAAIEFHRLHQDVFPVSPQGFAVLWRDATEKHVRRYLLGELSFQGQRRERLKEIFAEHRTLSDAEADTLFETYLDFYEKNWTLFPDVESCLDQLVGTRLGIISNGQAYQQRQKLIKVGIIDRFSIVTISEELGISKPDRRIFLEACRAAKVSPSECWHIGNNINADAQGSLSAGLRGVWLNRNNMNCFQGIPTIKSLSELKEIIDSQNQSPHPITRMKGYG
ncbi:MAG: HAD family hydrolase [Thermodesulfobacteriota bacterium]